MTDRFVVIGNPIKHSLSPAIHTDFACQLGLNIQYRKWLAPLDGFENTLRALQCAGVKGANVTVPFKQEAAKFADVQSKAVRHCSAANTIKFGADGQIYAFNTDGEGLCADLTCLLAPMSLDLAHVQVLLIGAGGAASGCIAAFVDNDLPYLTIVNRTEQKAQALAKLAHTVGLDATGGGLGLAPRGPKGLPVVIVNASSSSLQGECPDAPPEWWTSAVLVVDMMYASQPTAFLRQAKAEKPGLVVADGLGMLVNQAALAFEIWTSKRPDAASTLDRMRQTLLFRQ